MKTFTLQYRFSEDQRAPLWEIVSDFRRLAHYHSLMKAVEELQPEPGGARWFQVWEEVKMKSGLTMRPEYKVRLEVMQPQQVVEYSARIMGIMRLHIRITLAPADPAGNMAVTEHVQVTQIPLITRMFTNVFQPAHQTLFSEIQKTLTQPQPIH